MLPATLALDGAGRVTVDETVRSYSGVRLPGSAADAPALRTAASGLVSLVGSLTIDGSLGVGTAAPSARLSVVQAGVAEIAGNAQSAVFRATGPALGTRSGSEVVLNSTGLGSGNNSMSSAPALRAANGSDWYSSAIGLGMDVDNTPRAGASLFLHANGNVGIGTAAPAAKLQVTGGAAQLDGNQQLRFTDTDTTNNLKLQLGPGMASASTGARCSTPPTGITRGGTTPGATSEWP